MEMQGCVGRRGDIQGHFGVYVCIYVYIEGV